MAKKASTRKQKKFAVAEQLAFGKLNYIGFAVALTMIMIGFFTLSQGNVTLAPILLIFGYCIVMPIAIMIQDKSEKEDAETGD